METQNETVKTQHRVLFVICMLCYLMAGMASTLMSVYLPLVVREILGNVEEGQLAEVSAYINSLYLFGWMIGGISFGFIGDRMGRVNSFIAAVLIYSSFTIFTSLCNSWVMIVACRFITGFGVGGVLVLSTILISEVWVKKSRAVALGVLAVAFPVGIIATGIINNLIPEWRNAFLIGTIPLLVAVLSMVLLKESEDWKIAQKELSSDNKFSKRNLLSQPDNRKNLLIGSLIFGSMLIGLWAIFSWMPTWVQSLFSTIGSGQKERGAIMMFLGGGGIIGGAISGLIVNRLGYKKTMLLAFAGCFIMCFIIFNTNIVFTPIIYLETAALALFFGISQGLLSSYLPELFPTRIRATATGFCFNIGRLATATVVFFVGTLVTILGGYGNAVLAFSTTFLIGFVVTFFAKEVKKENEVVSTKLSLVHKDD